MMQDWADRLDRWERGEPVGTPTSPPLLPDSMEAVEAYLKALVQGQLASPKLVISSR